MAGESKKSFFSFLRRKPDPNVVRTSELAGAGVSIQKGDPRLKKGITLSNLSDRDRAKLEAFRKKQSQ